MATKTKTKPKRVSPGKVVPKKNSKSTSKVPGLFGVRWSKPLVIVLLFALIGLGTLIYSLAAVPSGAIKNKASGQCLENFYGRALDGNFVSTYPCNSGNASQKWSIYSADKSIRTLGDKYCLDVQKGGTAPKTKVHLWHCTGGVPQKWDILSNGQLRNPNSMLCLEAGAAKTFLGGPALFVNTCNSSNTRQQWVVPSAVVTLPTPPPSNPDPEPTTPPPTPSGSRPGPTNTGPSAGAPTRGAIVATSGQVIRNVVIDASGARYGVHVKTGVKGVVIENVIIKNGSSAGVYCETGSSCTIRNSEIHEMQYDGIKIHGSALVEGNYIHNLGKAAGAHADAVQMQYATNSNSVFRNNFCDIKFPPPAGYLSNACFQIQDNTTNVVIENNWLNGGNYTINCKNGTGVSGITIRNNRFGTAQYGRITGPCSMTGATSM